MSDQTMKDIKAGKGLKPLSSSTQSSTTQSGVTSEQRNNKGVTHENFTRHTDKNGKK